MATVLSPGMDDSFEQAERRFRALQARHEAGQLDGETFRLEVARLLLRDDLGVFWMIDAATGQWFCNRGTGWRPADPGTSPELRAGSSRPARSGRRHGRLWAAGGLSALVIVLVASAVLGHWPAGLWRLIEAGKDGTGVGVVIASPADGAQVAVGQDVAVESAISATTGRKAVAWVELQVSGQVVDRQPVQPAMSLNTAVFLSQMWRPAATGAVELTVVALAADGQRLGEATVAASVIQAAGATPPGLSCAPDAVAQGDVTIPPGMAFPPGARMDKVWQVQNSGSCAWSAGYQLAFVAGQQMGAPNTVAVPATASGGQADLPITFWAPAAGGIYTTAWQLHAPDGSAFGPIMTMTIQVRAQAEQRKAPVAPADLQASAGENGHSVKLVWDDRSADEDAFRIYRDDVEASVGLAPANAEAFVDEQVACGQVYRYTVVAFNAAGGSSSNPAEVILPACPPASQPPTLVLTVTPAQIQPPGVFTVTFEASDDLGVAQVRLWGEGSGDAVIDAGRVITCSDYLCAGNWRISWTGVTSTTLAVAGVAIDSSGQESGQTMVSIAIRPR